MSAPPWVPAGATRLADQLLVSVSGHERLLGRSLDDERARIMRLLADERMRGVWHAVARCRVASPREPMRCYFYAPDGLGDKDLAAGAFFYHANYYDQAHFETETRAAFDERVRPRLESVQGLRQGADEMGDLFGAEHDAVAAIRAAADLWEREILSGFGRRHPRLVGRDQGNPRHRGYALMMARTAHELYGRQLFGTVATVTNVALDCETVTKDHVRFWVKREG